MEVYVLYNLIRLSLKVHFKSSSKKLLKYIGNAILNWTYTLHLFNLAKRYQIKSYSLIF